MFLLQKLLLDKNLKKLVSEVMEGEINDAEYRTLIETQLTVPNETAENNWRLPGTRCLVRAEYDIWQEAVILGATSTTVSSNTSGSPSVSHLAPSTGLNSGNGVAVANSSTPPPPMYRIIVIGRLPAMEEVFPATDLKPILSGSSSTTTPS